MEFDKRRKRTSTQPLSPPGAKSASVFFATVKLMLNIDNLILLVQLKVGILFASFNCQAIQMFSFLRNYFSRVHNLKDNLVK